MNSAGCICTCMWSIHICIYIINRLLWTREELKEEQELGRRDEWKQPEYSTHVWNKKINSKEHWKTNKWINLTENSLENRGYRGCLNGLTGESEGPGGKGQPDLKIRLWKAVWTEAQSATPYKCRKVTVSNSPLRSSRDLGLYVMARKAILPNYSLN